VRSGRPITKFCDDLRLSIPDRLELFLELCLAIQHAHQKGVIHRDLKPANVLAYEEDGRRRVKVIDFGLAKALQRRLGPQTVETMLGAFFGTPAYMPPEQASGDPLRIDTRADIYSLGAILYELLTGLTPLDSSEAEGNLVAQVEMIRRREPVRPSQRVLQQPGAEERAACRGTTPAALAYCLRSDLDWIVLKCLEKEPGRRYPSVGSLMDDINRYRRHEPIVAAPPSWNYRVRKFTRRHRGLLAGVAAVILALGLGLVGSTRGFLEARRQAAEADRQRVQAELQRQKAQRAAAEAQAARHQAERRLVQFQKSLEILASLLAYLSPRSGEKKNLSLEKQLAEAAGWAGNQLEKVSAEDPLAIAYLQMILGNTLLELGEFDRAIQILEKVVALRSEQLGILHPDTLIAIHLLGKAYHSRGDIIKALTLYDQVQKNYPTERANFEAHQEIALLHDIAVAYQDAGRLPEALLLYRQIGQRLSKIFGADSVETLTALNNQALGYLEAGWFSEATSLLERVVDSRKRILGEQHPDTLTSSVSLAIAYQESGNLPKAVELLQRVLKVQQNQLGSAHPDTVVTLEHLAGTCLADGKLEEALHLFTQVHEAKISKFGSDSTETLGTLMNLALVYDELGNVSEATHILEKVSFEFAKTLGRQHPDTLLATYNLAIAWSQGGEAEKALVLCEKAALVFEALDFLHRSAYPMVQTLIRWCRRSGKFSQAEAWRNKWLAKTGKTIPSEEDGTKERMQIWRSRWGLELMGPPTLGLLSVGVGEEKFGVVP
jgi:tetratricopeptide (TPR) repeat protein